MVLVAMGQAGSARAAMGLQRVGETTGAGDAMTVHITMTLEDAKALEHSEIISFNGFSGSGATADVAFTAPALCRMTSSAGDVYDLSRDGDMFVATPAVTR